MIGKQRGLRFGLLGAGAVHLCVDMQRMFDSCSPWQTDWLRKVLPQVIRLCETSPERTIFSKFIPAVGSDEAAGAWGRYFRRWEAMTLSNIDRSLLDLVPELQTFVPPAAIVEKRTYSPWTRPDLLQMLLARKVDTIVISGGETDVCVLATVLGAVDAGFRVIVATDALCSSVNDTHDAIIDFYQERLQEQIEAAEVAEIIENWHIN
jgi:nicotinamidase-related amidase